MIKILLVLIALLTSKTYSELRFTTAKIYAHELLGPEKGLSFGKNVIACLTCHNTRCQKYFVHHAIILESNGDSTWVLERTSDLVDFRQISESENLREYGYILEEVDVNVTISQVYEFAVAEGKLPYNPIFRNCKQFGFDFFTQVCGIEWNSTLYLNEMELRFIAMDFRNGQKYFDACSRKERYYISMEMCNWRNLMSHSDHVLEITRDWFDFCQNQTQKP